MASPWRTEQCVIVNPVPVDPTTFFRFDSGQIITENLFLNLDVGFLISCYILYVLLAFLNTIKITFKNCKLNLADNQVKNKITDKHNFI